MSGGKSGSGASQTQTQTQKSDPWGPAKPYLQSILGQANTLHNQGGQYYPFSTTVPFSPETSQSLSGMENYANNGSQLFGQSKDALSGVLTGNTSNPALSGLYQTAAGNSDFGKQLFDSLKGDVTNSVNDQFSLSGRTGSPAQVDEMTKQLGNLATNVYGQERGYQQNAQNTLAQMINSGMGQASNVWQQGADPLKMLGQVGQAYEGQAGNQLQDLMGRWDYGQNAGWDSLSKLAGIVGPISGAGGTSSGTGTTTNNPAQPSVLKQGLSVASTIASVVAAF